MELKKKCSKCENEKTLTSFCKRKQSKDGLAYVCKDCQKEYINANPDKVKKMYENRKELCKHMPHIAQKQKETMKQWRKNNPHKIKMYNELQKEKRKSNKSEYFL